MCRRYSLIDSSRIQTTFGVQGHLQPGAVRINTFVISLLSPFLWSTKMAA